MKIDTFISDPSRVDRELKVRVRYNAYFERGERGSLCCHPGLIVELERVWVPDEDGFRDWLPTGNILSLLQPRDVEALESQCAEDYRSRVPDERKFAEIEPE